MSYEEIVKTEDVPQEDSTLLRTLARIILGGIAVTVAAEVLGLGREKKK